MGSEAERTGQDRTGNMSVGLDRSNRQVRLANGDEVPFDRLLIATGTRARPLPNPKEAALEGGYTIRTRDDAVGIQRALAARPERVLVIGAGFVGSEVASVCRESGLAVTLAERGSTLLVGCSNKVKPTRGERFLGSFRINPRWCLCEAGHGHSHFYLAKRLA